MTPRSGRNSILSAILTQILEWSPGDDISAERLYISAAQGMHEDEQLIKKSVLTRYRERENTHPFLIKTVCMTSVLNEDGTNPQTHHNHLSVCHLHIAYTNILIEQKQMSDLKSRSHILFLLLI